jgi:hypothetical protein
MVMVKVMATCDDDQVLNMGKKKEKTKTKEIKANVSNRFFFLVIKTL